MPHKATGKLQGAHEPQPQRREAPPPAPAHPPRSLLAARTASFGGPPQPAVAAHAPLDAAAQQRSTPRCRCAAHAAQHPPHRLPSTAAPHCARNAAAQRRAPPSCCVAAPRSCAPSSGRQQTAYSPRPHLRQPARRAQWRSNNSGCCCCTAPARPQRSLQSHFFSQSYETNLSTSLTSIIL